MKYGKYINYVKYGYVEYTKYGKYTDLQTYFLEKNIWISSQVFEGIVVPKFQGNRSVLSNMTGWG